ncbi:MAG: metal-dependent hydrolase [Acidobacteria bacterium]|nr:metal-dependent hydrolase [Acidobacteriota bacterium]
MDNLTHSLVGLAAAKAGLGRRSPYATFVCVAAANLPDIDIVALAGGPAFYLQHHRGITHSIVGMLALAVALPLLFVALERLWARLRGHEARASLKWLLLCSLLLSVSHPLLDWTNSYGVRPLLPWDGRWFYGDLLFIVDPWVWLLLGGACSLLAAARWQVIAWGVLALGVTFLFVRVGMRPDLGMPVGALVLWGAALAALVILHLTKTGERFGRRAPALALALVAAYCGVLSVLQARALGEAEILADGRVRREGQRLLRVAATPVLATPLTWRCLAEADRSTFRFDIRHGTTPFEDPRNEVGYAKPARAEAEVVGLASRDEAARVLLDFARFPVARVVPAEAGGWVVQFADLRYTEPGARARVGGFALDVPVGAPRPAR